MRKALAIAVVCALALVWPAEGQIRGGFGGHTLGPPASVTSPGFGQPFGGPFRGGFGGHALGPAPSVTSPGFGQPFGRHLGFRGFFNPGFRHHPFRHSFIPFFSLGVPVAVPFFDYADVDYAQPPVMQPGQPQPIIIVVPSGSGADTASEAQPEPAPAASQPDRSAQAAAAGSPETVRKPLPTTVVLRDGRRLELTDYALGDTLYDMRDGRTKKISLAEVDLPATEKANEDNGVEFVVPGPRR
jgi:hypothetical protein